MPCERCKGHGVRQLRPEEPGGVRTTRSLWPWTLCECVRDELSRLRTLLPLYQSGIRYEPEE